MEAYFLVFLLIQLLCLFTFIYPWKPTWPFAHALVHIPIVVVLLTVVYEWLVPRHMNIRIDKLLFLFEFAVVMACYAARLYKFGVVKVGKVPPTDN